MGALMLFLLEGGLFGTYLVSLIICPVWLAMTALTLVVERPVWRSAGLRLLVPPLALAAVVANHDIQLEIASFKAKRIVRACDEFFIANGRYPDTLGQLVPRWLHSVPRAIYCVYGGHFYYRARDAGAGYLLVWGQAYSTRSYTRFGRRTRKDRL